MAKFAHILGNWSRNIGDALYQLGGQWALQQAIPDAQVMLIGEQQGYPSYWNPRGGNPVNSFDLPSALDVDYLVLMGPMFRPETEKIWGKSLAKIMANGTRLILLGIGAMNYEPENIKFYREFLKKYKPHILISRDRKAFQELGDLALHAYDGIDFGFFTSDFYPPLGFFMAGGKSLALSFDKIPEPVIKVEASPINDQGYDNVFEFNELYWKLKFPALRTRLCQSSRYLMFLEGVLFPGNEIRKIAGYNVIRLEHRPHPMLGRKTFRYPNVLVNDTPYVYSEIYSHADLTLSTRVHACVMALSYGKPAMLISKSQRVKLFSRLDLDDIQVRPVILEKERLSYEKQEILAFLRKNLSN